MFFTQYAMDVELEVRRSETQVSGVGTLPNVNPVVLANALKELLADPKKKTKTISLNANFDQVSYKSIQPGFWFADGKSSVFYRMPTIDELRRDHHAWWRHL
jgi:hypothetical protein